LESFVLMLSRMIFFNTPEEWGFKKSGEKNIVPWLNLNEGCQMISI